MGNLTSVETRAATWAVVALKSPDTAKSRLRPLLSDAERRDLYFIMAYQVLNSLKATPGIERVLVVTACAEVDRFAAQLDVQVIRQSEDRGTAAAFTHAVMVLLDAARRRRPQRLLMIAGDLPLVTPEAVSALLAESGDAAVSVVPDRQRVGTNALLCSPPDVIEPCFGENSYHRHLAAASARSIAARTIESPALSLDIDIADDLALLDAHYLGLPDAADNELSELLARLRAAAMLAARESSHDVSVVKTAN